MSIAQINSYRITLLEYKAKLNPIRIDFILFSKKKKKWYHAEIHIARIHSIDFGCYCYSWFLKPATGQLSRHVTFICKQIKKVPK